MPTISWWDSAVPAGRSGRKAGSRIRPCLSICASVAVENTNRWKLRDRGSVNGRAATFSDSSSQPALVWIARQSSSQVSEHGSQVC